MSLVPRWGFLSFTRINFFAQTLATQSDPMSVGWGFHFCVDVGSPLKQSHEFTPHCLRVKIGFWCYFFLAKGGKNRKALLQWLYWSPGTADQTGQHEQRRFGGRRRRRPRASKTAPPFSPSLARTGSRNCARKNDVRTVVDASTDRCVFRIANVPTDLLISARTRNFGIFLIQFGRILISNSIHGKKLVEACSRRTCLSSRNVLFSYFFPKCGIFEKIWVRN